LMPPTSSGISSATSAPGTTRQSACPRRAPQSPAPTNPVTTNPYQ
jgi:hypothetical protein